MIIFPATGVFSGLGPMGVSMFFVSAVVAQLVFTLGGSGFAGGNGSMMIEVVVSSVVTGSWSMATLSDIYSQPFFHILANDIAELVGEDKPEAVIATTLVAFALSSLLTGRLCSIGRSRGCRIAVDRPLQVRCSSSWVN
jgi:SulP family sulfate permease